MTRKLILISSLILIAIATGALIWTNSAKGKVDLPFDISPAEIEPSADAQAVRETILRARRIDIEAEYTFDTNQFDTVYINDPRGGEISDEALAQIQEIRQDVTLRIGQVGYLDYKQTLIESRKHNYDKYIADLRAKQAAGTLTGEEQIILEGETNGWPTPEPVDENLAAKATQTCEQFIAEAASWEPEPAAAYPAPDTERAYPAPKAANPAPEPALCPTLTPTQFPQVMMVPHRGHDPATLPPKSFEIDIYSIEIEGDVAKAIVHKSGVTSKLVLVKVDEQWYIAGAELLKFAP